MLDDKRLKSLLREHFDAEAARDVQWIKKTVAYYPDDPVKKAKNAEGREAVGQLWENYFRKFRSYQIECGEESMYTWPEQGLVFAKVSITAIPAEDFEGFPAGKPFCYRTGALCWFNELGEMTKEMVFGSLGQVLLDLRRMHDFLAESATAPAKR
jgi:hypothetical protein